MLLIIKFAAILNCVMSAVAPSRRFSGTDIWYVCSMRSYRRPRPAHLIEVEAYVDGEGYTVGSDLLKRDPNCELLIANAGPLAKSFLLNDAREAFSARYSDEARLEAAESVYNVRLGPQVVACVRTNQCSLLAHTLAEGNQMDLALMLKFGFRGLTESEGVRLLSIAAGGRPHTVSGRTLARFALERDLQFIYSQLLGYGSHPDILQAAAADYFDE